MEITKTGFDNLENGAHDELISIINKPNLSNNVTRENIENENEIASETTESTMNESPKKRMSIEDFEVIYTLGRGSYAKVSLAKNIHTNKLFALKIIDKKFLKKERKQYEALIEKNMLSKLIHPNIIKLYSTFQDNKKLYFILEYCPNRDLSDLVRSQGKLSLELSKFFAAEIISALEYMHGKGIYHRDLKPENIVLDESMHLKILDFATANVSGEFFDKNKMTFVKLCEEETQKIIEIDEEEYDEFSKENDGLRNLHNISHDLVGTTEYVSPEVLSGNYGLIGPAVDLWALGIMIYLFLHGRTPFKDRSQLLTFDKILNSELMIDESLPEDAKDIILRLLDKSSLTRLGAGEAGAENDYSALKAHGFFKDIDFSCLQNTMPPIDPKSLPYSPIGLNKIIGRDTSISPIAREGSKGDDLASPCIKEFKVLPKTVMTIPDSQEYSFDKFNKQQLSGFDLDTGKDDIVLETIIQKKSPWFHYNTRLLRLFSNGRLEYYEPKTLNLKGTIVLTSSCRAVVVDEKKFDLVTKKRTFVFKHTHKIANEWVEKINNIIHIKFKKPRLSC